MVAAERRRPVSVERATLKKDIELWSLFSLSFGTIVGVGWITVMGSWLGAAGSIGSILAFAGGGAVILLIGLCYAEIAGMYPVSGGEVAYVYETYGTRLSFATGWLLAYSYISTTSFEAVSIGWLLSAIMPGFGGPVVYSVLGADVRLWDLVLGLSLMGMITIINYRGGKTTTRFQDIMTVTLLAATAVFVSVALIGGDFGNLEPTFVGATSGGVVFGILTVMAATPFFLAGFDTIPQAMGELAEGVHLRLLPKIMALSIGLSIVFYCLVILAAAVSLPRAELLAFDLPVAGALEAAFESAFMGRLVLFAGLCGLITTWNAIFFASTRVIFSLGRAYMIPPVFRRVHPRYGSPTVAVVFVGIVGAIGALFGRNAIGVIVSTSGASFALVFAVVVLGIAKLRSTHPQHERPYRLPVGRPLMVIGAIFGVALFLMAMYEPYIAAGNRVPPEWTALIVWVVLGALFYWSATGLRCQISEKDRRWLVLNEGAATPRD